MQNDMLTILNEQLTIQKDLILLTSIHRSPGMKGIPTAIEIISNKNKLAEGDRAEISSTFNFLTDPDCQVFLF